MPLTPPQALGEVSLGVPTSLSSLVSVSDPLYLPLSLRLLQHHNSPPPAPGLSAPHRTWLQRLLGGSGACPAPCGWRWALGGACAVQAAASVCSVSDLGSSQTTGHFGLVPGTSVSLLT